MSYVKRCTYLFRSMCFAGVRYAQMVLYHFTLSFGLASTQHKHFPYWIIILDFAAFFSFFFFGVFVSSFFFVPCVEFAPIISPLSFLSRRSICYQPSAIFCIWYLVFGIWFSSILGKKLWLSYDARTIFPWCLIVA